MARPRSFDADDALAAATRVFLTHGFDGATLEDLTGAMGVNKPSLYAAFGDKSALYAKVLAAYAAQAKAAVETALDSGNTLEGACRDVLLGAIDVYAPVRGHHLGCLIATTATTAAGSAPAVRKVVATFLAELDYLIEATLRKRFGRQLTAGAVASAAGVLSATMFALAIRARAGTPRERLLAIAESAVDTIGTVAKARPG